MSIALIVMQATYTPQSGYCALLRFRANRQGYCSCGRCTKQPPTQKEQNSSAQAKAVTPNSGATQKAEVKQAAEVVPVEVIPTNHELDNLPAETAPPAVPTLNLPANNEAPKVNPQSKIVTSLETNIPSKVVAAQEIGQILKLGEVVAKIENELKVIRQQIRKRFDSLEQLQQKLDVKVDRLVELQASNRAVSETPHKFHDDVIQLLRQMEQKLVNQQVPSAPRVVVDQVALDQDRESFRKASAAEADIELKYMREEKHQLDIAFARNDAWLTSALIGIASVLALALFGQISAASRVASLQRDLLMWQSRYHESIAMRDAAVAHEKTIGAVRESAAQK